MATIKQVRPDLLQNIVVSAAPIPKQIPPRFFEERKFYVEDIGQPVTAAFFTNSEIDPHNWLDLPSSSFQGYLQITGGCSRNMMECEDFGILSRKHSILVREMPIRCLRKSSLPCPLASFLMENFGLYLI